MIKWLAILGGLAVVAYAVVKNTVQRYTHGLLTFDFRANGVSILPVSIDLDTIGNDYKKIAGGEESLMDVKARLVSDQIYLDVNLHATIYGIGINGNYTVKAGTLSQLTKVTEGIEYTIMPSPVRVTVFVKLIPQGA